MGRTVQMDLTRALTVAKSLTIPTLAVLIKVGFLVRMDPDASKLNMFATTFPNAEIGATRDPSALRSPTAPPQPARINALTLHPAPPATASQGTK